MAQIGTLELSTETQGWLEVPVYDRGSFDFEPIEVECNGKWGVLQLTNPPGDTPLEIYTETRGWQAISAAEVSNLLEGFESGDWQTYWKSDSLTGNKGVNSTAAKSGNYGFWAEGEARIWSLPGMGLPHYPSAGDTFGYWYYPRQWPSPSQYWFFFGYQSDTYPANGYEINWISDGTFRVRKRTSSGTSTIAGVFSGSVDWPANQWLRGVVDWHSGGGFDTWVEYADGSQLTPTISSGDSAYTSGGLCMRCSGNGSYYVDELGMIDWSASG